MHYKKRTKIAELLLSQGVVTKAQMLKAVEEQKFSGKDLSSTLVDMGFVTHGELAAVLGEEIQLSHKKRLGEVLVDNEIISKDQLTESLVHQRKTGQTLGKCLMDLRFIDENTLFDVLGAQFDTPHVVLENIAFNSNMLQLVPLSYMEEYSVIPLFLTGKQLTIAMSDPANLRTQDHLRFTTGKDIEPVIASEASIELFIERIKTGEINEVIKPLDAIEKSDLERIEEDEDTAISEEYGEAVVNIVNSVVTEAIEQGASDIHFDGIGGNLRIRFRIDGALIVKRTLKSMYYLPVISRLKILGGIDIAEKRKPQDGKFHIHQNSREVDIRVSSFPTVSRNHGENEKVVLRILDADINRFRIDNLGLSDLVEKQLINLINEPFGLILVTGPTGSGKSSTLYASINEIDDPSINIITMEDPVEYTIEGVAQGQILPKAGFTFASGIRAILRQDPDVIMVGEMRDTETAEMAVQAALTGHLVFSTLHTNNASSTFFRLIDMGVEPYLLTASIKGIIAQRLVRTICPNCKEEFEPAEGLKNRFNKELPSAIYKGKGCAKCNGTGYKGRTALFELLIPDDKIKEMVINKSSASEIESYAQQKGLLTETLSQNGFRLIAEGITTVEEVLLRASD